ncbi:MAG TPA: DUF5335 family protein [Tepidisphaeraceae bacterium]|nr:DUF5335 family protein [Tepidisphaeraceae bacterium]
MTTYEVPPTEWHSFFDQFSRLHQGQPVDVQTVDSSGRQRSNTHGVPLLGITAETAPSAPASPNHGRLDISAGDERGVQIGHSVTEPARVKVSEWNDGLSASLEIESGGGLTTRVRVGPVEEMLPPGFILDGIESHPLGKDGRS